MGNITTIKIRNINKKLVIEISLNVFKLPMKNTKTDDKIPNTIINPLLTFSPQIFLIPSDAKSKNKEVLRNIPDIQIPRYKQSKWRSEPNFPILAAV